MEKHTCGLESCTVSETPHAHMPKEVREYRGGNNLEVSKEAQDLAKLILSSFDGLTDEQRDANNSDYDNVTPIRRTPTDDTKRKYLQEG